MNAPGGWRPRPAIDGELRGRITIVPLPDAFDVVQKRPAPAHPPDAIGNVPAPVEGRAKRIIVRPVAGRAEESESHLDGLEGITDLIGLAFHKAMTTPARSVGAGSTVRPPRDACSRPARTAGELPPAERWITWVEAPTFSAAARAEAADRLARLRLHRRAARLMDHLEGADALARALEIDVVDAHRLMSRRPSLHRHEQPEEVVLQRATGEIDDVQMLRRLADLTYTSGTPAAAGRLDASVSSSGTLRQLTRARRDGLLSQQEYRALVERVRVQPLPS